MEARETQDGRLDGLSDLAPMESISFSTVSSWSQVASTTTHTSFDSGVSSTTSASSSGASGLSLTENDSCPEVISSGSDANQEKQNTNVVPSIILEQTEEVPSDNANTAKRLREQGERLYGALPLLSSWSIRLLRLLPSESAAAPLQGQLHVAKVDENPDFEALSYTWAEPFEDQSLVEDSITLDSHELTITGNLGHALKRLRYRGQSRSLWIDALCIDQCHDRERGYQIEIMEHIYSKAKRVLAWLGEDSEDAEYIYKFCKIVERQGLRPNHKVIKAYQSRWPNYKRLSSRFASRRYFGRRWIIQEVCHARDVLVLCGKMSVPLHVFSACIQNVPASRRALDNVKELCDTFAHLRQALNDWRVERLRSPQAATLSDFVWMLKRFHRFDCSDTRDKIYAIGSLWKDSLASAEYFISADYSVSCERLYTEFAVRFIAAHLPATKTLSQLMTISAHQASNFSSARHDSKLLSWIPDWRLDPAPRIGPENVHGDPEVLELLGGRVPKISLRTRCYGKILETHCHYRDWTLMASDGPKTADPYGRLSDEEYVPSLGQLCWAIKPGDLLCQPYSTYWSRRGHVADAALVLRPTSNGAESFRIVGRCPLDLFWHEAQGESRTTDTIISESVDVMIE